jgi:O-antigen/teichoic acid export membrane protein
VAWVFGTTVDLLASNMAVSLTVEAALAEDRLGDYAAAVLRRLAAILVPLVVAGCALAPAILRPFGHGYGAASTTTLRLLLLATLPRAVSTVFIGVSRVERRVGRIAAVQFAQAALVLASAALLLPRLGIAGAGIAAVAGQLAVGAAVLPRLAEVLRNKPVTVT